MTSARFIREQLNLAGELREVDGYDYALGGEVTVWGPAGQRSYSAPEAEAFVRGLIAARAGAHLRAAQPNHDAGAYLKAVAGEPPAWREYGRRPAS